MLHSHDHKMLWAYAVGCGSHMRYSIGECIVQQAASLQSAGIMIGMSAN